MAQTITYDPAGAATVLTTRRPMDTELTELANLGEADSSSKVIVDDDAGSIDIVGLKRLEVVEDAAPAGNQRIWTGYVGARPYRRSDQYGTVGGAAREIEIELTELNTILGDHLIPSTDTAWKRPRESAGARLTALLASGYVDCEDRGKVVYPALLMDANDYRGQAGGMVLQDIATFTKYDYSLLLDDEGETQAELFFDVWDRSTVYSATKTISNADDGDFITLVEPDEQLTRDPTNVASGVQEQYAKGSVYETKASTSSAFRARDVVSSSSQATTKAQAQKLAQNYLDDHDEEDDTVTLAYYADPADVNAIRRAQRVQAKLTFAPGMSDFTWCRVVSRKVTTPAGHDLKYRLDLSLKPQKSPCTDPTELLAAHATIAGEVAAVAGSPMWAHGTYPSGLFAGIPVNPPDDPISAIPFSNPANANDGDVATYAGVGQSVIRYAGTIEARLVATLDGTYAICRLLGTVALGSSQWQNFPPDRIDYWDGSAWQPITGPYLYGPAVAPRYWTKYADAVETTQIRWVWSQVGVPTFDDFWNLFPLGIRVNDLLAYGTAV